MGDAADRHPQDIGGDLTSLHQEEAALDMVPAAKSDRSNAASAQRSERLPKYAVIRNWMIERITSGEFACGQQLPSEHDIMEQFGVSRVTARQAFDALRSQGLVESWRGKGYYVSRLMATASLERLQSFGEMVAPLGVTAHSDVIELLEVAASDDVSDALRIEKGESVVRIVRARLAGPTTVSLDVSYLPLNIGRRLMLLDLGRQDVFVLMEKRLAIEIGYAEIMIDTVPAPAFASRLLNVAERESLFRLKRLTVSNSGDRLMFEQIYARLDMMQFSLRVPRL
ncbi:MAG: GntR family transcriptional regulator [Hyphomicrobiaceae bacterium]|nr:GntR family transcriptional regulator [Hyphomicrobiaceae bacterium]